MTIVVNGERIEDDEIRREAEFLRSQLMEEQMQQESSLAIEVRAREWAVENVIERVLLRQAALQEGGGVEQLIAKITAGIPRPNKNEIAGYYQRHRSAFYVPERIRAAHIVKNVGDGTEEGAAYAEILRASAALQQGRSFEEVADEYSDCPGRGGDLGFFSRGEMVEQFEEVVFALQPGQISAIFRSPFGFHIAKVYARTGQGVLALSEARGGIEELLYGKARDRAVEQFVQRLRAEADVRKISSGAA